MSVITFDENSLDVENFTWGLQRNDIEGRAMLGSKALEVTSPTWKASISAPSILEKYSGAWLALIMKLQGRVNQLALHNLARPFPLGTLRGSITFNGNHEEGAETITLQTDSVAGKTLLKGDFIGFGYGSNQQVVTVLEDAVTDANGVISVDIHPALRSDLSGSTPVTWNKPRALFRNNSDTSSWKYTEDSVSGIFLDLVEDVRS